VRFQKPTLISLCLEDALADAEDRGTPRSTKKLHLPLAYSGIYIYIYIYIYI
jgi:hypothetical protein